MKQTKMLLIVYIMSVPEPLYNMHNLLASMIIPSGGKNFLQCMSLQTSV